MIYDIALILGIAAILMGLSAIFLNRALNERTKSLARADVASRRRG